MQNKGIFQWNEHYPSLEKLEADINRKELYVLENSYKILGIIVLTEVMDEEYIPITWLTPTSKNLYIHRLATDPAIWGKGYRTTIDGFCRELRKRK